MIVRNEAHQLAECLRPLSQLFDEIVIVDTGSTDDTWDVARQFATKVVSFPWCDDFSAARNESLRHATGEWIFWLDADDRISPENIAKLSNCLSCLNGQRHAFLMNTACCSRYACEGANLITHTRLFRRHPELKWQGRVHEQLRPQIHTLGYETFWSDVQIDHTGYQDQALQQRKLQRDLRLLRMDYATDPDDVSTLLHLGLTYFHLGRFGPARIHLERLLAQSTQPSDHLRQVYGVLATMLMREGKIQEAVDTLDRSLVIFPDADDLLYSKAECLYELDQYHEARETLTQIIAGSEHFQYRGGVPGDICEQRAPRKLADIHRLERDYRSAESLLLRLLSRFPHDTLSWQTLGRVFLDSRQRVKFLAVIEHLRVCPQGEVFATMLMAMWQLNAREFDAAGQTIEKLISLAPLMPMPRILRVEWLNQTAAPITARIQACRDLLRVQPSNQEARQLLAGLQSLAEQPVRIPVAEDGLALAGRPEVSSSVAVSG